MFMGVPGENKGSISGDSELKGRMPFCGILIFTFCGKVD